MTRRASLIAIAVLTAASIALLWTSFVPLGVPGEWTWTRIEHAPSVLVWSLALVAICGGVYVTAACVGERQLDHISRGEVALRLTLLAVAGFVWLTGVQSAALENVGLAKGPYVLFSRNSSGYFWQARYDVASTRDFLAGYESSIAVRGKNVPSDIYLHLGTHPPGLTLCFRGLLDLCARFPGLVTALNALQPESVRRAFEAIEQDARREGKEFGVQDAACLWLATLMVQAAAALTVVPLYLWLRTAEPRATAWRVTVLWPLVPALAIFLPKSDALFPLIGMTAAWLWRWGWTRGRLVPAALAGLTLCGGMILSLAFLPAAALIGVQTLADGPCGTRRMSRQPFRLSAWVRSALLAAAALAGFLTPVLLLHRFVGIRLLGVWLWNFRNHALFYEHFTRTYWKWLLANPVELSLAVGWPIVVLAFSAAKFLAERRPIPEEPLSPVDGREGGAEPAATLQRAVEGASRWSRLRATALPATLCVWGLLWLSGKNMGEAARLWIFLMPWIVACTSPALRDFTPGPLAPSRPLLSTRVLWWSALVLQLIVSAATVLRVDAFEFGRT